MANRAGRFLSTATANPFFAYGTIVALQLKVVWGMWWYRDLTSGDTSSYFRDARSWATLGKGNIAWSPLYTAFYGALYRGGRDVYASTIEHRLIIVFAATVMVLVILRSLLPAAVAWLVAAWWAILPINFDTLYEVHLFAFVVFLAAGVLVLRRPSRARRAATFGVLTAAAVLVRNEFIVTALIFGAGCAWYEIRLARRDGEIPYRALTRTFGAAVFAALLAIGVFYARSTVQYPALGDSLHAKHTQNICQIYAFNYQQRHPDWKHSPWTECGPLMQQEFGRPLPTLLEAISANPGAMERYVAWNVHLVPSGVQLATFNQAAGRDNPDYAPAALSRTLPVALTGLFFVLLLAALFLGWQERAKWCEYVSGRVWLLLVLLAGSTVVGGVMLTERPRPSYMFPLSLSLMFLTGLSVAVIGRRFRLLAGLTVVLPVAAILLLVFVPSHYHRVPRPLHDAYGRLHPFASVLAGPGSKLVTTGYNSELCWYLAAPDSCSSLAWTDLKVAAARSGSFGAAINAAGATIVYADDNLLADPTTQSFVRSPDASGWRVGASGPGGGHPWKIFVR